MKRVHAERQSTLLALADAVGDRADRRTARAWRELLRLLQTSAPADVRRRGPAVWRELLHALRLNLRAGMERIAERGYATAVHALKTQGPKAVRSIVFPPLHVSTVLRILRQPVNGSTWEQDLSHATKLADPDLVGSMLAFGAAQGKTPREVMATLLPVVKGVQSSAKRIARTYGMQIAHHAQMEAHARLGPLIRGYQVFSAKAPSSRTWHVERSGTIYYARPARGQKSYHQMPHPPLEADDPGERPSGTPHLAWNCMCYLVPVLWD